MSNQADIRDIQILSDLKAAFGRFGEDVLQTLVSLEKQFEEIQGRLQERQEHWQRQVDEAQSEVDSARSELSVCYESGYYDDDGDYHAPNCSSEQDQVATAEKHLAECESNLDIVKQWRHRIESQIADFENDMHRLAALASDRTGSAQAFLTAKIEILNRYVTGGSGVSRCLQVLSAGDRIESKDKDAIKGMSRAELMLKNAEKGHAFAEKEIANLQNTQTGVQKEITVVTESGTKTRLDAIGRDPVTGKIKISEMKSSTTAALTKHQKIAHPEIKESGATVVGKGKDGYEGGTTIPPTKVDVIRPE